MKRLEGFVKLLSKVFVSFLICLTFQGANCRLVLVPAGPTVVNTLAGSNVTLAVSFSGASDPVVTWSKGNVIVGTWTIGSTTSPDIAPNSKNVLRIEKNGSLTFINVPLEYTGNYTIDLSKSGLEKVSKTFTLKIYENIQTVTLSTQSQYAKEGAQNFKLQYSMLQGVVEQQIWKFNGKELKNSSHYLIEGRNLVILWPNRRDAGLYSVLLKNPFSNATAVKNISVLYGPDVPIVEVHPAQPFYAAGTSISLSCLAEGFPSPIIKWMFEGQILSVSRRGVQNLTNVQTSQGGVYTCDLHNELTAKKREKNLTVNIYEEPPSPPVCSVLLVDNVYLQYQCSWIGGTPQAQVFIPALSNTSIGAENISVTVKASAFFNMKTIICVADHPLQQETCNITASSPMKFLPMMETSVDPDGKIAVSLSCISAAAPQALVSWSRGSEAIINETTHQLSIDTVQLTIRSYNISSFLVSPNYTCLCFNPLGSQSEQIQLQGPSISDSGLFSNLDGTIITLTWEVPPTAIVTGFDIQMNGPALLTKSGKSINIKSSSDGYSLIQSKPGSARSADIFTLNPKSTYRFRIIPKARLVDGPPSQILRIGPGEGLSGPAIAGLAAGIPCSILFLVLLCVLIYFIIYCNRNISHQTRYPVSRAVGKTINPQRTTPHNLVSGVLRSPPDYNGLHKTMSERSMPLPRFVPPPPIRFATTV